MKKIMTVIALAAATTLFVTAPAMGEETAPETPSVVQETADPAPEPVAAEDEGATAKAAPATQEKPKEFEAYEVQACWQMATSDGVEGTYEWPQTRVYGDACDAVPACGETVEFQHDTYWIRDKDDKKYLKNLETLNSPADDAQLEPHGYFSTVVHGPMCEEPPTEAAANVTFVDPTCDAPDGSFATDEVEGVRYEQDQPAEDLLPKVIVRAYAEDGYTLTGQTVFEHTYKSLGKTCDTPNDNPTTPTAGQLPDTGAPTGLKGLGIAAVMLVAGMGLLKLGRRVV